MPQTETAPVFFFKKLKTPQRGIFVLACLCRSCAVVVQFLVTQVPWLMGVVAPMPAALALAGLTSPPVKTQ